MNNALLLGATGHLGRKIAAELKRKGYEFTAVIRNEQRKIVLTGITDQFIVADVINSKAIAGITAGYDIVISALGKSVSPNDKSKASFRQVDFEANTLILTDALKNNVSKFVYVSAFSAEKYRHLEYFKVHHEFSENLKSSGIDYSIIKPPALFSAFIDLIDMAMKGRLMTIGKGNKLTNPIDETDLAKICVESIKQKNATIEAGGKTVYSRRQLNEIIQQVINPGRKVRTVPIGLIRSFLPLIRLVNKNMFDKFAFFTAVMEHDTVAPKLGSTTLEEYLEKYKAAKKDSV